VQLAWSWLAHLLSHLESHWPSSSS